jgi:predicted phosphoribosyltransferase
MHLFSNRTDAGNQLGEELEKRGWDQEKARPDLLLGLARGGVEVARPLAQRFAIPWDVLVVRKIGAPGDPELGIGAVCEDGSPLFSKFWLRRLGLKPEDLADTVIEKQKDLHEKVQKYRGYPLPLLPPPRHACVVDDGLATGITAEAAAAYLRRHGVQRLTLAVPVATPDAARLLEKPGVLYDSVFALESPEAFGSVGSWYEDFSQVSDARVLSALHSALHSAL